MILVIGGSGFIGSELLMRLEKGSFLNLDKEESQFFQEETIIGDIRDIESLEESIQKASTVVLLAAEHRDDVEPIQLYYDVNVKGTKNVLNLMTKYDVRNLVFTSSVAVYGLDQVNSNERSSINPFNDYGKSKYQAEQVISNWYEEDTDTRKVTIIRPTVVFGERNRGNVYNLINQISKGKFIRVGKGLNKKSIAYVGNIVEFIKLKIVNPAFGYEVFNYSDKPDLPTKDLIDIIEKELKVKLPKVTIPYFIGLVLGWSFDVLAFLLRRKLPISSIRVKKFCASTIIDSNKALEEFKPKISLEEGLKRTIDFDFKN
jgi:nucleoside-diphosphate-sugar epimerase